MDHEVIGPMIRQGRAEGRAEGMAKGEIRLLLLMIQKRFGRVSPAMRKRIAALSPAQIEQASLRLLDAGQVEDLFA